MEKYKALSYSTKSNIFMLVSVAVAILYVWVDSWLLDVSWTILWGIGIFYWGAARGERKEGLKNLRKTDWYAGRSADRPTVVG
jgi:hypothetical protein